MTSSSDVERMEELERLAVRCETGEPGIEIDQAIHDAVYPGLRVEAGRVRLLNCSSSLDCAQTLSHWLVWTASEIAADGLPLVVLVNPGTGQEAHGSCGRTLELTWCAAALRARAMDAARDGGEAKHSTPTTQREEE